MSTDKDDSNQKPAIHKLHSDLLQIAQQQDETSENLQSELSTLMEKYEKLNSRKNSVSECDKFQAAFKSHFETKEKLYKNYIVPQSKRSNALSKMKHDVHRLETLFIHDVNLAVDCIFSRLQSQIKHNNDKVEKLQKELQGCKFTQDSQNGKRMMNRIRLLEHENEELIKAQNQSGRTVHLESEIILRQNYINKLNSLNNYYDKIVENLENECEKVSKTLKQFQEELVMVTSQINVLLPHADADTQTRFRIYFNDSSNVLVEEEDSCDTENEASKDSSDKKEEKSDVQVIAPTDDSHNVPVTS